MNISNLSKKLADVEEEIQKIKKELNGLERPGFNSNDYIIEWDSDSVTLRNKKVADSYILRLSSKGIYRHTGVDNNIGLPLGASGEVKLDE